MPSTQTRSKPTSRLTVFLVLASLPLLVSLSACGPEYPSCDDDDDCHEAEYCVNGQCQQCRGDADCPAGQSCASGACEPIDGYCDDATPCPDGSECDSNRCRVVTTAVENACAVVLCPAGTRCVEGVCQPDAPPACTMQSVYFEFDSDALDDEDRRALQDDARCAGQLRPVGVHLTGHADGRGTEEYNLALSERRAQAVMRYLQSLGVAGQFGASGMGEEVSTGTDEASWRLDRRVDVHPR